MTENPQPNPYDPPRADGPAAAGGNELQPGKAQDSRPDQLVVLATFINATEAHMFCSELISQGIEARVNNELSSNLLGATIAGPSSAFWIEVVVLSSDVEQALEIKNRWLNDQAIPEEAVDEWTCPCGETVDEGFSICWNCGGDYEDRHPADA